MTEKTKLYEISNDPTTDTHILVPTGYGGLNDEELQAMEDQVRKADRLRMQENEELVRLRREEQARLKALDDKNPAYKKQKKTKDNQLAGRVVAPLVPKKV